MILVLAVANKAVLSPIQRWFVEYIGHEKYTVRFLEEHYKENPSAVYARMERCKNFSWAKLCVTEANAFMAAVDAAISAFR